MKILSALPSRLGPTVRVHGSKLHHPRPAGPQDARRQVVPPAAHPVLSRGHKARSRDYPVDELTNATVRGLGKANVYERSLSCVLLADRHLSLSEGLRGLLETVFDSVVMVADQASLVEGASRLKPDVAVVDLSLAAAAGLDWLHEVRRRTPELVVIVLSVHDEETVRRAALDAGADAFVLKRCIVTDLLPAIARAGGGFREKA